MSEASKTQIIEFVAKSSFTKHGTHTSGGGVIGSGAGNERKFMLVIAPRDRSAFIKGITPIFVKAGEIAFFRHTEKRGWVATQIDVRFKHLTWFIGGDEWTGYGDSQYTADLPDHIWSLVDPDKAQAS